MIRFGLERVSSSWFSAMKKSKIVFSSTLCISDGQYDFRKTSDSSSKCSHWHDDYTCEGSRDVQYVLREIAHGQEGEADLFASTRIYHCSPSLNESAAESIFLGSRPEWVALHTTLEAITSRTNERGGWRTIYVYKLISVRTNKLLRTESSVVTTESSGTCYKDA